MKEDIISEVVVLYIGLFGWAVYRSGDVSLSFLVVTGVLLTLFPLTVLAHRRVFQSWLSKYRLYPYSFIALALVPMLSGILIISSLFQ